MKSPLYFKTCQILDKIRMTGDSFKNVVYKVISSEDQFFKKVYCLAIEITKNLSVIDQIIQNEFSDYGFEKFGVTDTMMKVLLYEMFFSSQRFRMGGKLVKFIKSRSDSIKKYLPETKIKHEESDIQLYFRVLKHSDKAEDFKEKLKAISTKDSLINDLYLLNRETPDYELTKKSLFELRDSNLIKIQSKSSALPAFLLRSIAKSIFDFKKGEFDMIDACSAPGNKTLQLADYFCDKEEPGKVHAFDYDLKRIKNLYHNIDKAGYNSFINAKNVDFLSIDPFAEDYNNCKIILCDPSCSGSGTFNNSLENRELGTKCCLELADSYVTNDERLTKLSSFQKKIVEHAMKFPSVNLISYSTCSIYRLENEDVVESILKENPHFKLAKLDDALLDEASNFHTGLSKLTKRCLRACKSCFKLDGFFVAIFIRK